MDVVSETVTAQEYKDQACIRGMRFGSCSGRVVEDRYQGVDDPAPGDSPQA